MFGFLDDYRPEREITKLKAENEQLREKLEKVRIDRDALKLVIESQDLRLKRYREALEEIVAMASVESAQQTACAQKALEGGDEGA